SVIIEAIFAFAVTIFAPAAIFIAVVCVIAFLAFNEFLRMYHMQRYPDLYVISLAFFVLLDCTMLVPVLRNPGLGLTLITLVMLIVGLSKQQLAETRFEQIAIIIAGTAYIGSLVYFMTLIRLLPHGREAMLG